MIGLGPAIAVNGSLLAVEDVEIGGTITGTIEVQEATLTVGDTARVRADIRGARVVVHGEVYGAIVASERIELAVTAQVRGSLSAPSVVLADGATFNGGIDMAGRTVSAKLAAYHDKMGL